MEFPRRIRSLYLKDVVPPSFRYSNKQSTTATMVDFEDSDEECLAGGSSKIRCSSPIENDSDDPIIKLSVWNNDIDDQVFEPPYPNNDVDDSMELYDKSIDSSFTSDNTDSPSLWTSSTCENCDFSVDDFCSTLVAIQTIHKLPDTAMQAFQSLFCAVLPKSNKCPKTYIGSMNKIQSRIDDDTEKILKVCSEENCMEILPSSGLCPNKNCIFNNRNQRPCSFFVFNIRQQIESICQSHLLDILHHVQTASFGKITDVVNGSAYLSYGANPALNGVLSISLILSSDGANAFKASDCNLWPIHALIAELPPKLRVSFVNVINLGFWLGVSDSKKPKWNLVLDDIIKQLDILKNGFIIFVNGKLIRISIRVIAATFDLPAVASIWSVKLFNGKFGCISCKDEGCRIIIKSSKDRNGSVRIWPPSKSETKDNEFYKEAYAQLAVGKVDDYYGVYGISPLASIGSPAQLHVFDPMHLLYRGAGTLVLKFIFPHNSSRWKTLIKPRHLQCIDKMHEEACFPHEFNRTVPTLNNLLSFKASEIKNLLSYTLLPAILPFIIKTPDAFHFVAIYVAIVRICNQPLIKAQDITDLIDLIDVWRQFVPIIMDEQAQTYSTHALMHLPDQIRRFGASWAISAFSFESYNGQYTHLIKSGTGILSQLRRRIPLLKASIHFVKQGSSGNSLVGELLRKLFPRYENFPVEDEKRIKVNGIFNKPANAWANYLRTVFGSRSLVFGNQMSVNGIVYQSASLKNSSCLIRGTQLLLPNEYKDGNFYVCAQFFIQEDNNFYVAAFLYCILERSICCVAPKPLERDILQLLQRLDYGRFFKLCILSDEMCIMPVESIACKLILYPYDDDTCFLTDALPFEHD